MKWIFVVLIAIVVVLAAELAQEDVDLTAECITAPNEKVDSKKTADRLPFLVDKDHSALQLRWWQTFAPTKIKFAIWFNAPTSSTPILSVDAGGRSLVTYTVQPLTPHSDTGTYHREEWGHTETGFIDLAVPKPETMRSSDSDLVLTASLNGVPVKFLCPGATRLQLTGERTNLIASFINAVGSKLRG